MKNSAFVIPEIFFWIVEHWEIFVGVLSIAGAVAAAVIWLRRTERQSIHETNQLNVNALESLGKAREQTIDVLTDDLAAARADVERLNAELSAVRSEYKIVAGLVLSDLILFESNRVSHLAALATLESEKRILNTQIEMLERKIANHGTDERV